jgi:hypothetical protein
MRRQLLVLAILAGLVAPAAMAQTAADTDTDATIDAVLGDHQKYREAFDDIQAAVAVGDVSALAAYIPYDIPIFIHGGERMFESEGDFTAAYDEIFTPEIVDAVAAQSWETLFVNAEGVMFGAGEVWLNGICVDETCSDFDVRIVAIQTAAD